MRGETGDPCALGEVVAAAERLGDSDFIEQCRRRLEETGALVVAGFLRPEAIAAVLEQSAGRESDAYFADTTHNVYLTPPDSELGPDHVFNHQVTSTKGLIADDQIPADSSLRTVYNADGFQDFLCRVLGTERVHPYADELSSINVHFAPSGRELGWHFDNSSFAVTILIQAPEAGGVFEYVPAVRDSAVDDMGYDRVRAVLDGNEPVRRLEFEPGDLVMFRGRDALHRVTPTRGATTRILVVFAYNGEPGVGLSDSALRTFYGRTR